MIVCTRIAIPALVVSLIGKWLTPFLVSIGWLGPDDPFRKIGFIISLGTILGAAMVDICLSMVQAVRRFKEKHSAPSEPADWKRLNLVGLLIWGLFWGVGIGWFGSQLLHQPRFFVIVAVCLCFLFV